MDWREADAAQGCRKTGRTPGANVEPLPWLLLGLSGLLRLLLLIPRCESPAAPGPPCGAPCSCAQRLTTSALSPLCAAQPPLEFMFPVNGLGAAAAPRSPGAHQLTLWDLPDEMVLSVLAFLDARTLSHAMLV